MSDPSPTPHPLLPALGDPSPAVRAEALRKIRFRDLKDPEVLSRVLSACADETPVSGVAVDVKDPFAAFFTGSPAAAGKEAATLAAIAAERLEKAGLPESPDVAALLAKVVREAPVAGPLGPLAAKLLSDTKWTDPVAAVEAVVPALDRHDVALFEALVKLPSTVMGTICTLAAVPFRPRLFQELMNHPPSQEGAVAALVRSVLAGTAGLDEARAVTLVSTLTAWSRAELVPVARHLESDFPLLLAWLAIDDAEARPRLRAALEAGSTGAVSRFWGRIGEVLRHRDPIDDYPVATFLRLSGTDPGVVAAWGVTDDAVAEVLHAWVSAVSEDADRAWTAVGHLIAADRLGPSRDAVEAALGSLDPDRLPPFEPEVLRTLATVSPPLAGLESALLFGVSVDGTAVAAVVAAAPALGPAFCARLCAAVLDRADAAGRTVERLSTTAVREAAPGIDVDALEPLLPLVDAPTAARFEALRSVVRAG